MRKENTITTILLILILGLTSFSIYKVVEKIKADDKHMIRTTSTTTATTTTNEYITVKPSSTTKASIKTVKTTTTTHTAKFVFDGGDN